MKKKLRAEVLEFFRQQGSKGGKAGAKRRMEKLTPEQHSAVAKKAGQARWKARKKSKDTGAA